MTPYKLTNKTRTFSAKGANNLDIIDRAPSNNWPYMESLWRPSQEELEMLLDGGAVSLAILGDSKSSHPAVSINVRLITEKDT